MPELPWGSHFCQFYQTKKDLLDIFVPFLKAGLEGNESCLWVASPPIDAGAALKALKKEMPDFETYTENGQLEIIPGSRWRTGNEGAGRAVVSRLNRAILKGFDGLRIANNAFLPEDGKAFIPSETDAVGRHNMIAAFAYPRDKFDALGLMEIVKHHRFALVKNADQWEVIESTEARVVKDALKQSEAKLRSLFSNMKEGFAYHRIVVDEKARPCDYVFLEVNDAFERLTGLKRSRIIGRRVTEVLPGIEKDPTDWIGTYGKVALTGRPAQFENYSESIRRWYLVSAFSQHKGYFAVIFSDITERKRIEEEIRALNEKLKQNVDELTAANRELEAFSYSISHDLRAPLRHIAGFVELLETRVGEALDEKSRHYFEAISTSAHHMGRLIDDLLSFSRTGRVEMRGAPVNSDALVREIIRELESEAKGRDVVWEIGSLPEVYGDPTYLRMALTNLLSNALKYTRTREHAAIAVASREAGNEYIFSVTDNGVGFDMKYHDKLFGLFQRLHRADEFEGTGVGLAHVQRIIHRHGGRVWAEGAPGEGATFSFSLPKGKEGRRDSG